MRAKIAKNKRETADLKQRATKHREDMPHAVETPRIGIKLRHARMVRGSRLRDVAESVGCSESLLSKIENDKAQPSLQMLHKIASALGTSIGLLFAESAEQERIVLRTGERQRIPAGKGNSDDGIELEWIIPYPESRLLSGSIHIVPPDCSSEGDISHEGEEVGYILEGLLELTVDEQIFQLGPGDSFCFCSERPHRYRNIGAVTARVLWINTPPTF